MNKVGAYSIISSARIVVWLTFCRLPSQLVKIHIGRSSSDSQTAKVIGYALDTASINARLFHLIGSFQKIKSNAKPSHVTATKCEEFDRIPILGERETNPILKHSLWKLFSMKVNTMTMIGDASSNRFPYELTDTETI